MLLDRLLPSYQVSERHERLLPASPERALQAMLDMPVTGDFVVRSLFRLRGLPVRAISIAEWAARPPFVVLGQSDDEFVFGIARSRAGFAGSADEWRSLDRAGLKIAANFHARPGDGGSLLSTETRVLALDRQSLRAFRGYWSMVGPFSAVIRRRWLRAAALKPA